MSGCKTCEKDGRADCPVHGDTVELSIPEEARRLAAQYLAAAADSMAEHAARCKAAAYRSQPRVSAATVRDQLAREGAFTCAELHLREDALELTGVKPPARRRHPVVEPAGLFEVAS